MGSQASATVTGNQIIRNGGYGIYIGSKNHGEIVITGNKISDNTLDGIHISSDGSIISTGVQIRDNQITDNGKSGIANIRGRARIRGNLITGNRDYGIWMEREGTIPDIGTEDDPGNNIIYDNRAWEQLWNNTPHEIQAVGNYWGPGTEDVGPEDLIGNDIIFIIGLGVCNALGNADGPIPQEQPVSACDRTRDESTKSNLLSLFGKLPLHFVANYGQFPEEVIYYAKSEGATVYCTE